MGDRTNIPANVDSVLSKPPKLYQLRAALAELVPASVNRSLPRLRKRHPVAHP